MKFLHNDGAVGGTDHEGAKASDTLLTAGLGAPGFSRKPTVPLNTRKWVKYDKSGATTMIHADKHALTHQLGVQVPIFLPF